MKRFATTIAAGALTTLASAVATAAPTVDGTRDAEYGGALAVQTVNTEFGDTFSELNAGYATVQGGRLYLMLTGNVENNFNKLEIFFDTRAGGENTLTAAGIPDADGGSVNNLAGLTFDAGFEPDRYVFVRRGSSKFDLDYLTLGPGGSFTFYENVFGGTDFGSGTTGTGTNASPIGVGYNGSNTAGVVAGTGAADQDAARAVATGLELSIALADLGVTGDTLDIAVLQNGTEHSFLSNQFLGGLPPGTGNLANPSGINLNNFAGAQFFTVAVPEPAALGLIAVAAAALIGPRRRMR